MIREQIERELGQPLESVYAEFDPAPLASASLAQVHQARLHDGRRCAVKVQYPGIDGIVRADLRNMTLVLRWLAKLERDFDYRDPDARGAQVHSDGARLRSRGRQLRNHAPQLRRRSRRDRPRGLSRVHHAARAHDGTDRGNQGHRRRRARACRNRQARGRAEADRDFLRPGSARRLFPRRPASRQHPGSARPQDRAARLRPGQGFPARVSRRHRAADVFDSQLRIATESSRAFTRARLSHAQRQSRHAARVRRRVSRQHDQVEEGLRGQGPDRAVLRGAAARDPRQSRGRSSRRRAAGQPHDGSAERARQIARLASRSVRDDHAVRAATHDGASQRSCRRHCRSSSRAPTDTPSGK